MELAIFVAIVLVATGGALALALSLRRRLGRGPDRSRLEELSNELRWGDRWRVYRAVTKGRAVADSRLAPAAVARARYVRSFGQRFTRPGWRRALLALGVLQLILAGVRLVLPGPWTIGRTLGLTAALLLAAFFLTLPWQHRFYGRRAARAEELNLRLLPPRSAAAG